MILTDAGREGVRIEGVMGDTGDVPLRGQGVGLVTLDCKGFVRWNLSRVAWNRTVFYSWNRAGLS